MAIAYVNSVSAVSANNSTVTTAAVNMTGANLLVMMAGTSKNPGLSATRTDSEGNSYTSVMTPPDGPGPGDLDPRADMLYALNPTVSSSMTFSINGSSQSFPGVAVSGYSGVKTTSPLDVTAGAHGSGVTSLASGTVTPSEDNCLVMAGFISNNTNTPTAPSGFTGRQDRALSGGLAYGVSIADQIQTTATARNPSWSWTSNNNAVAAISATFKAATGAAAAQNYLTLLGVG